MGIGQRKKEKEENKIEHNPNDRVAQLEKTQHKPILKQNVGKVKSWMKHTLR